MAKSAPVAADPVPQSEEEAAYHANEFVKEDAVVHGMEAEEEQELAAVKQKYADLKRPHQEARDRHFRQAHAWGEAHRQGRKTIKLSNGRELQWRLPSSSSLIFDQEKFATIVTILMRLKEWPKYLKVELRKNNIKADLEQLQKANSAFRRLLALDKTEYFRIK